MPIAERLLTRAAWLPLSLLLGCSPPAEPPASPANAEAVAPNSAEPVATVLAEASPPPEAAPAEPPQITIRRTEIYGMVASRAGKLVTITPLLSTSEAPPPIDAPAVLLLKTGEDQWTEVASVTLKKAEAGGKIQVAVDEERAGAPTAAAFRKNANVKLQIDQQVP